VVTEMYGRTCPRSLHMYKDIYYNGPNISHFLALQTTKNLVSFTTDAHPSLFAIYLHRFSFNYRTSFSTTSSLPHSHSTFWLAFKDFLSHPFLIHSYHIPKLPQFAFLISATRRILYNSHSSFLVLLLQIPCSVTGPYTS
jgi:hypothetical protein